MKYNIVALLLCLLSASSCKDESLRQPDSEYKNKIDAFIRDVKSNNQSFVSEIEELEKAIDFGSVLKYDLNTTEKLLVANITSLKRFQNVNHLRALFFLNNGEIVRSQISVFEGSSNKSVNGVIVSLLNREALNGFTGKISLYSIFQNVQLTVSYKNGELELDGVARKIIATKKNGRVNGCTDWFFVTTYHYEGGFTRTVEVYLFTSCDEPCGFAGARANCGGGGGGGAVPDSQFPPTPNDGDVFETTDVNGFYTKYVYNSVRAIWVGVERILPVFTLQDNPTAYSFLQNIRWPAHGQVVVGPDNFRYTYHGGSATWVGHVDSQNKLCGSYTFVNTAEGLTAEIITLSASAMHRPSGQHLFHLWGSGCVTFGSSTGLTDSENASRVFNSAWGETMDEAEAWLNARQEKPLEAEYSNYLKVRLTMNLGKHANGYVAFSTGPCSGSGIVSTAARYCN